METLNLMPHQETVLNQTKDLNRVAYYLDMGLGKTFVGAEKMWQQNNMVNLIVCQKSKVNDWVEHITTYYSKDYEVFDLTKKNQAVYFKNVVFSENNETDVVGVINYDLVFRRSWLFDLQDFTLMLDESSLISNENTKRAEAVLKMKPESVILLSGTPTAGKYESLWSQLKLLGWNIDKKAYWNSYVDTEWFEDDQGYMHEKVIGYKHVPHLMKRLSQFGAVFMKTEEVINLPDQVEQKIMLNQTSEYRKFSRNSYLMLNGIELVGDTILTKIMYQRQLCGQYHKEKLNAFKDLVESTEDRLIVFYNFTAEYEAMKEIVQEIGRPVSIVRGGVDDRIAYNECNDSVTFIQYQAGSMGGNFQKANKIIYFTLPLGKGSCDLWEQSKKRIHRIGQKKTCFYYYLIVSGSIETHNLEMLELGKDLTNELFEKH